jgi:hypothetical protein
MIIEIISKIGICFAKKMPEILTSIWGCSTSLFVFAASFLTGYEFMIGIILFCILSDAFWGIVVSIKRGGFVLSELGRNSVIKIAAYANAVFILIGIEKIIGSDLHITTSVATMAICGVELWSISGNILIIKPNFVFFKLLRPALRGEISRKLGVPEENVDEILDNQTKN